MLKNFFNNTHVASWMKPAIVLTRTNHNVEAFPYVLQCPFVRTWKSSFHEQMLGFYLHMVNRWSWCLSLYFLQGEAKGSVYLFIYFSETDLTV